MARLSNTNNHNHVYRQGRFLALIAGLSLLFLFAGCASTQQNIWVDKDYGGTVSELYLRMDPGARIPHKMSVKARAPKITPEFKTKMIKDTHEALQEVRKVGPGCIADALTSHGVNVKDEKDKPAARLILTPIRIESYSDEYSGVSHGLWYLVVLTDNTTNKQIWKGDFRLRTKYSRNSSLAIKQEELDQFCGAIAKIMADAGFLPK